jgi:hypothetical protein
MGYKTDKLKIMDDLYDIIETVQDYQPGDIISLWDIQQIMADIQKLQTQYGGGDNGI